MEGREPGPGHPVRRAVERGVTFLQARFEPFLLERTPLFDSAFYLSQYPDVANSKLRPVLHYLRHGAAERRDPHPLFDTEYYLSLGPDLGGLTPLGHYLLRGAPRSFDPNPLFDGAFYTASYPDVAASGKNPLVHYVESGRDLDRRTHPLFDPFYYKRRYPDAGGPGVDALAHYLRQGLFEGRDPNPLFDLRYYRARHPDLGRGNPVDHYLRVGSREGRDPSPLFSTRLYLQENPDVERTGENPLVHFLESLPEGADPRSTGFAYRSWLRTSSPAERPPEASRDAESAGPLLSLLTAIKDMSGLPAEPAVAAVRGQYYPRWEWIVAVPAPNPEVAQRVQELSHGDHRIRPLAVHSTDAASMLTAACRESTGQFVAVLGPADILDPGALGALVREAGRAPAGVVYADEDRVDEAGRRFGPHFKPAWNQDLLFAWNYLGRPTLIERARVEAAGGFEPSASPAHELDLLLKVTAALPSEQIRHVPAVLCHRLSPGGPASPPPAPHGSPEASAKVLATFLERRTPGATVASEGPYFRPVFPLPPELPLVSIVIPTRDRLPLLRECLDSLLGKTDYPRFEILVVDNDTKDHDALAYLAELGAPVRVIRHPGAFDHSALNNRAVAEARGSVLVLLNNDTTVKNAAWLTEMVRLVLRPEVGAVGAKLFYPDGSLQHAGVIVGMNGVAGHAFGGLRPGEEGYFGRERLTHEYSAVTAACLCIRRSVFEEVHGLDADRFPVNFNDVDLCLRLRARGYRILYCAAAELEHHESASRRNDDGSPIREAASATPRFKERWSEELEDDPFYNPNLSLAFSFELAVPPRPRERRLRPRTASV